MIGDLLLPPMSDHRSRCWLPSSNGGVNSVSLVVLGLVALLALIVASPLAAAVLYVEPSGNDANSCATTGLSCASIQRAVNVAVSGDEIRVAAGTYTFQAGLVGACPTDGKAVVCFTGKTLTLRGGYAPPGWSTPSPTVNPTVIDGQNANRGVFVRLGGLIFEGFTVKRGRFQGAACCADSATFAFGGGLWVDQSDSEIRFSTFDSNQAIGGGSGAASHGGAGAGGGIAIRAADPVGPPTQLATLVGVTLIGNLAQGGSGPARGGYGLGGGLWSNNTVIDATGIDARNNSAIGGTTSGNGQAADSSYADGLGGGLSVQANTSIFRRVRAANNTALGGGATTNAGGGFGGGFFAEVGGLTILDAEITGNQALGPDATNGGLAFGGGVMTQDASLDVQRSRVISNQALGGDGAGGSQGPAGGGAAYISRLGGTPTSTSFTQSVLADNLVQLGGGSIIGGGGGGLFLQGVTVTLDHLTIVANQNSAVPAGALQGEAIVLLTGSTANLSNSVVAEHAGGTPAMWAQSGTTFNLSKGLFSGNSINVDAAPGGTVNGAGTYDVVGDVVFRSPGAPNFDYHIAVTSPAINHASASAATVDVDGESRVTPDTGADEQSSLLYANGFEEASTMFWSATVP